jgi:hypothetical protein
MVTAQASLIIAGAVFVAVAITNVHHVWTIEIPDLKTWNRLLLGTIGSGLFACAFLIPAVTGQSPGSANSNANAAPARAGAASASPLPAASVSAKPMPATSTPAVAIDTPKSNAEVPVGGFAVNGTVSVASLGTNALWMLDYNGGTSYTIDESVTVRLSGTWYATEGSLKGDSGPLTIAIVLANQSCNSTLANAKESNLPRLPSGCKPVAETTVNISNP